MTTLLTNILFSFFLYCFIGWIWECAYVSFKTKKVVNRGFLYGPWLPIYGFGALLILWMTQRWIHSPIQVFIVGMLSASTLEYFTGSLMELIFHVRYWDYSDEKYNINGHVCLHVSLAWGIASLILVYLVHPLLLEFISLFDISKITILLFLLLILFIIDCIVSINEAMHLKNVLSTLQTELRIKQNIQSALRSIKKQYISIEHISNKISEIETLFEDKLKEERNYIFSKKNRNQLWTKYRKQKESILLLLEERINAMIHSLVISQYENSLSKAQTESIIYSLQHIKNLVIKAKDFSIPKHKPFQKAISMLERNPNSISLQYKKAIHVLNTFKKKSKKKGEN